jgi:NADH-quinone oxidoreductase subunit L
MTCTKLRGRWRFLIVLAVGSVLAGYVGVPHALHGSNEIESFLEPSFEASASAPSRTAAVAGDPAIQPVSTQAEPRPANRARRRPNTPAKTPGPS